MANNIVELVSKELSPNVIGRLANVIGESPASTARAASATTPALLAGFAQRAGTETGAADLLSDVREGGYDRDDPRSALEVLDDPASRQHVADNGRRLCASTFGNRQEGLLGMLGEQTGLKRGPLTILMSLLAPLAMRVVGSQVRERNLDAKGLQTYLGGQRAAIASVLPSPLARLLEPEQVAPATLRPVARTPFPSGRREVREVGEEMRRRPLWPFLAALLAALVLFTMARSRRPAVTPTAPTVQAPAAKAPEPPTVPTIEPPAPPPAPPAPNVQEPAIGGGPPSGELEHPSTGGVHALALYLASGGASGQKNDFVLEGVTFDKGSANLTKDGTAKVGELATLLKSHPNAKIRLVGHTDNTGQAEANRVLSEERAASVRDELVRQGISSDRIETAGVGSEDPVAKNDSPANREKNRRIDVTVLSQ
jgi:outer membrane protein OmpA-like peptidoglycan-associated protein